MFLQEENNSFLHLPPSLSLPLFLSLLPSLFLLLSMCLPPFSPHLTSPPHVVTHCAPLHLLLHPITTQPIPPSSLPLVLPTIPLFTSLPQSIHPSIVRRPSPRPLRGLHPPFSHPYIPSPHLPWPPLLAHDLLHFIHPSIPALCRLLTAVVSMSRRSCTGDMKQLQNQQRPKPYRLLSK